MDYLDDLPKRHGNHSMESKAEVAFSHYAFWLHRLYSADFGRKSYGTDCQIKIVAQEGVLNIDSLKGVE